jgi:hypothetical protein
MNYTQQLIDSLSDSEKATQVLDAHPEAARGTGNHGESPLLMAVYMGNEPLARRIAGMRPTDIHEAAALGDASRVEKLLDVNPEHIGSMSSDGWTPLHLAAFFGRREVLAGSRYRETLPKLDWKYGFVRCSCREDGYRVGQAPARAWGERCGMRGGRDHPAAHCSLAWRG